MQNQELVPLVTSQDLTSTIKNELEKQGINSELIVKKMVKLLDAKGVTNSGIEFEDNKTILETIKLFLKIGGMKGISDGAQIAIFNNMPGKNENLKF